MIVKVLGQILQSVTGEIFNQRPSQFIALVDGTLQALVEVWTKEGRILLGRANKIKSANLVQDLKMALNPSGTVVFAHSDLAHYSSLRI